MSDLNEELLGDDPESLAVEADEPVEYTPQPSDSDRVVVIEPKIITIGRKRRRDALRELSQPPSQP